MMCPTISSLVTVRGKEDGRQFCCVRDGLIATSVDGSDEPLSLNHYPIGRPEIILNLGSNSREFQSISS